MRPCDLHVQIGETHSRERYPYIKMLFGQQDSLRAGHTSASELTVTSVWTWPPKVTTGEAKARLLWHILCRRDARAALS